MPRREASVRWVIVASCSSSSSSRRSRRDSTSMMCGEKREKDGSDRPSACHLQRTPAHRRPEQEPALPNRSGGERSTYERVVHELNVKSLNDFAGSVNTRILPN